MTNPSPSSDITISLDDFSWKISSVARKIEADPENEALYYTLLTPVENVISSSNKDIVHGPQVVLKKVEGKRTPDAAIMRIQPEVDPPELGLIAIFEVKPGPCTLAEWSLEGQEPQRVLSPDFRQSQDAHDEREANACFLQSYLQICEQASRALDRLPAHSSIPAFFLTGFYFYLIVFSRGAPADPSIAPQFEKGTEDAGYNALVQAHHARLVAMQRELGLKYEVKYFRERYIDHQGHLTAEFAAALQLAIEGQRGLALTESWFTALAEQGVADEEKIADADSHISTAVQHAIAKHEEAIDVFVVPDFQMDEELRAIEDERANTDPDYNPNESDSMDADSSHNADTSMSTTSSPIAPRVARSDAQGDIRGSRNPLPSQPEAADPSSSDNDPFGSPLSPVPMSSPEAPRQGRMTIDERRLHLTMVTQARAGDGNGEDEQTPPSPTPHGRADHNTGPIGYNATGRAGARVGTECDMDFSE